MTDSKQPQNQDTVNNQQQPQATETKQNENEEYIPKYLSLDVERLTNGNSRSECCNEYYFDIPKHKAIYNIEKLEIMIKAIDKIDEKTLLDDLLSNGIYNIKKCKIIKNKKANSVHTAYVTFNDTLSYFKALSLQISAVNECLINKYTIYPVNVDLNSIYTNQYSTQLIVKNQYKEIIYKINDEINYLTERLNRITSQNNAIYETQANIINTNIINNYNHMKMIENKIDLINNKVTTFEQNINQKITKKMLILAEEMGLNVNKIANKMNQLDV